MKKFSRVLFYIKKIVYAFVNLFQNKSQRDKFESSYFFIIIVITCFFYSLFVTYVLYYSCRSSLEEQVAVEARHINNVLTTVFDETAFIMTYIGKQVAQHDRANIKFISKMLLDASKIPSKNRPIYSWSLFDWVDPDGYALVNSQVGITKEPLKKVSDSYVWKCSKYPWTLQISSPTIGNTSGMWVIPTGMGVVDNTNKYLGTLNIAFNVSELNSKVEQSLVEKSNSFLVLDENFNIILQSTDNVIDPKSSYYRDVLHDSNYFFIKNKGSLFNPIYYKDITYFQYIKMEKYPYIILTGYKKSVFIREFQSLAIPRIIEFIIVGCFCFLFFYYTRRKFLNLVSSSNQTKEKFLHRMNLEVHTSAASILSLSSLLLRHLKGEIDIGINKEKQILLTDKIHDEAIKLNTLTTDVLDLSYLDVNKVIAESVAINTSTALIKNIKIKCSLAPYLSPLCADELRLKQIISGLINLSLEYNPKKSTIIISSASKVINNKSFLIIKIQDDGFSLNIEDIRRISKGSDNVGVERNGVHLEFSSIEKLINLYHGRCTIYDKRNKGKVVSIIIPYNTQEDLEKPRLSIPTSKKDDFQLSDKQVFLLT